MAKMQLHAVCSPECVMEVECDVVAEHESPFISKSKYYAVRYQHRGETCMGFASQHPTEPDKLFCNNVVPLKNYHTEEQVLHQFGF